MCVLWVSSYWLDQIKYQILHRERRCSFLLWTFQRIFQQQWRIWKIGICIRAWRRSSGKLFPFATLSRQRRSRKEISQYSAAQTMSSILLWPYPEPIVPNDKSLSRNMSSQSVSYTVRLFLHSEAHWNCNKTCSSSCEQITCYEGKKLVNWFNLHQRCDQTLCLACSSKRLHNLEVCNLLNSQSSCCIPNTMLVLPS